VPPADPYIGKVIAGDIEIQCLAGAGAMGSVYRGYQRRTQRDVAVKVLHRELSGRLNLVRRFDREAKISGKLRHPHVVEVYFTGELDDGTLYIVMEYLDGAPLSVVLKDAGGTLPLDRTLRIARQIAEAVGEGHELSVVHRDLKPENVMLVRRGENNDWVKVLDFGIARATLPDESMETAAGAVFGTARYISPEGAQGTIATAASDVYSLGIMLYQMLCGVTPFDGDAAVGLLVKHVHDTPKALRLQPACAMLPEAVETLVMQCLAKDPQHRFPDGRALAAELTALTENLGISLTGTRTGPGLLRAASRLSSPTPAFAPKGAPQHAMQLESTLALAPTINEPGGAALPVGGSVARVDAQHAQKQAPEPHKGAEDRLQQPSGRERRWGLWVTILMLGVLLAAALVLLMRQHQQAAQDDERARYIDRARNAFTDGHYISPPGENVKELVIAGLLRWPQDPVLRELRSNAEHEMITMAIAAKDSGDVLGERNAARDAYALDATDNSARFMRAQAEDDLKGIASGASIQVGSPRLVFEAPPLAKPGERVEMTCRVIPGAQGLKAKVSGVRLTVLPNGQTAGSVPVTLTQIDGWNYRGVLTAPSVASYDVSFEASVDGIGIRAMRDLDVAP
jgi:eukaryotic-like serine/threonine-protein kinase